jgi:hypothetical protein
VNAGKQADTGELASLNIRALGLGSLLCVVSMNKFMENLI